MLHVLHVSAWPSLGSPDSSHSDSVSLSGSLLNCQLVQGVNLPLRG